MWGICVKLKSIFTPLALHTAIPTYTQVHTFHFLGGMIFMQQLESYTQMGDK